MSNAAAQPDPWLETYKAEMTVIRDRSQAFKVELPEGVSGNWAVEHFEVPEEPNMYLMRAWRDGRPVPGGTYTRLKNNSEPVFMSDTPAEVADLAKFVKRASGDILITGLGLGLLPRTLLRGDLRLHWAETARDITSITVVELEADVIALVEPHLRGDDRLRIVQGDAFKWQPEDGQRFDWAWHDIWPVAPGDDERDEIRDLRSRYQPFMRSGSPLRQMVWLEEGM